MKCLAEFYVLWSCQTDFQKLRQTIWNISNHNLPGGENLSKKIAIDFRQSFCPLQKKIYFRPEVWQKNNQVLF